MKVSFNPDAEAELQALPTKERVGILNAYEKLKAEGDQLPFPHSSQVRGADRLRELRPRSGRSKWRAFYRRIGTTFVIAAVGPEASDDPVGFRRAVANAEQRLERLE